MYAIVRVAGHQFKVAPDDALEVPRLPGAVGEKVTLEEVLLLSREGEVMVGRPTVEGARVEAEVLGHERGPKVLVFKMKRRKNYRRRRGHRQPFTRIRIISVEAGHAEGVAEAGHAEGVAEAGRAEGVAEAGRAEGAGAAAEVW